MSRKSRTGKLGGQNGFLYGALVLTAGMAAVKVIGALFKIPLKYAIGEYGMGLFNVAYNFYGPVFSLATAGFPIAVSRLVSENASLGRWNDVKQVKRVAFPMFLAFGAVGMLLLTLTAPLYCQYVIDQSNALYPMLALAPAILFACMGSVYRGYYEGLGNMAPTALSEVAEALVKLAVGLGAAGAAVSIGTAEYASSRTVFGTAPATWDEARFLILALAAAGAVLGVTCGSAVSLLYLALRHRLRNDGVSPRLYRSAPPARNKGETAKKLLKIAAPVAAGSVAMNAAGLIDATFLQNRLKNMMGSSPQRLFDACRGMIPAIYLKNPDSIPTFLYGCYSLALTIYLLVPAVTQTVGISALPAVTEAWTRKDRRVLRDRMEGAIRVTVLFCFPAGLGISALSGPIVRLLYGKEEATPIIAGALAVLGVASLAAALSVPLSNLLQAVGRADLPVKLLVAAMGIKIGANWVLCGIPELHIQGAGIGTLLCYLFLVASQLWCLRRVTGIRMSFGKLFLSPTACALLCAGSAWALYHALHPLLPDSGVGEAACVAASVFCGAFVYVVGLLLLKGFSKKEISLLPAGQKIAKMLEKCGWI